MRFCRDCMRDSHFGTRGAPPCLQSRSGEGAMSSETRPRLPCGPGFPQALLTSRRPVLPPDRAPFCFAPKFQPAASVMLCLSTAEEQPTLRSYLVTVNKVLAPCD